MFWWCLLGMLVIVAVAGLCTRAYKKENTVIFLSVCVLAGVAYGYLGSFPALRHYWKAHKEQQTAEAMLKSLPSKTVVIDRLEELLKHDPNRPKGWALLGRIRMSQGHVKESLKAYQKAWELKPSELRFAIGFGEALLLDSRVLPNALRVHCEKALNTVGTPGEKAVLLNLLGINAYKENRYSKAITYWEKALPYYPSGSPDEKQLLAMIHKAQS